MPDKGDQQRVLSVVVDKNPNLGDAVEIAERQKAEGKVVEWRPAVVVRGIEVILSPGANSRAIAEEYTDAGFLVIEVQFSVSRRGKHRLDAKVVRHG